MAATQRFSTPHPLRQRSSPRLGILFAALLGIMAGVPGFAAAAAAPPRVEIVTNLGGIIVELQPQRAPQTVENFLGYVDSDFYNGAIFHRVIDGFMVQTGGYDVDMNALEPGDRVQNESRGGLRNLRGTLAMARLASPNSARAQFFFNLADNPHLDARNGGAGYTVFGRVLEGMSVVDAIGKRRTARVNGMADVPLEPVIVERVTRLTTPTE